MKHLLPLLLLPVLLAPLAAGETAPPPELEADPAAPLFPVNDPEDLAAWQRLEPAPASWVKAWRDVVAARWLPMATALATDTVKPLLQRWETELGYGIRTTTANLLDLACMRLEDGAPVRMPGATTTWRLELDHAGPGLPFFRLWVGDQEQRRCRLDPAALAELDVDFILGWDVVPPWRLPLEQVRYANAGLDDVVKELCAAAGLDHAFSYGPQGGIPVVSLDLRRATPLEAVGLACEMCHWDMILRDQDGGDSNGFLLFGGDDDGSPTGAKALLERLLADTGSVTAEPAAWHALLRADIERKIAEYKELRTVLAVFPKKTVATEEKK